MALPGRGPTWGPGAREALCDTVQGAWAEDVAPRGGCRWVQRPDGQTRAREMQLRRRRRSPRHAPSGTERGDPRAPSMGSGVCLPWRWGSDGNLQQIETKTKIGDEKP